MNRRTFLASTAPLIAAAGGCIAPDSPPTPAHTVTVYLGDRDASREVDVTVTSEAGDVLFQRAYSLSDDNEAHEDATFPASSEPETVVVTVEGTRFERDWPGFEVQGLPCEGDNRAGVELWVLGGPDEAPSLRLGTNCQYVTMDDAESR